MYIQDIMCIYIYIHMHIYRGMAGGSPELPGNSRGVAARCGGGGLVSLG